jgi:hypothetical protein
MEIIDLSAAMARFDAGVQVSSIEPSQIEHVLEIVSRVPKDLPQNTATDLIGLCGNADFVPKDPDEQVALMMRFSLLNALMKLGVLNDYMKDDAGRKQVFAAAATIPCDKDDLTEVWFALMLRDAPRELIERTKEEANHAASEPDRPKISEKFIGWIRSHW